MKKLSKDGDQPVRIVRKSKFLLRELYRSTEQKVEHKNVVQAFRELLKQIKQYMDEHSQKMQEKREKLVQFNCLIRCWENKTPADIDILISKLNIHSKSSFLIYKTMSGWRIKGTTITGTIVNEAINFFPDYHLYYKEALLEQLRDRQGDEDLEKNDPLHQLVVEYFGYFRPSMFISYSWPSPNFKETLDQDTKNREDIHNLVEDLEFAGIRTLIDKKDLARGDVIDRFIDLIDSKDNDYVCVMGTPLYQQKYESPTLYLGGEANKTFVEASAIVHRAKSRLDFNQRIFTAIIDGDESTSLPAQLKDKIFCKFSENDYFITLLSFVFTLYQFPNYLKDENIKRMIKEFENKVRPAKTSKLLASMKNKSVIIFTDPGVDDFAALALALAPNVFKKVEAIVACAGNVPLEKTVQNVLDICHLAKRNDIPVLRGSEQPITPNHQFPSDLDAHGENGLNGIKLAESPHKAIDDNATKIIIDLLRYSKESITFVSLAGLTDMACVLKAAQEVQLLDRIQGISMMGGVFDSVEANAPKAKGNEKQPDKYGEFNFLCDPDATKLVFEICRQRNKPIPVVLFDLGFTHRHCLFTSEKTKLLQENPDNIVSNTVARALNIIPPAYQARFRFGPPSQPAHDVFPVMALIKETLFDGEWVRIRCQNSREEFPGKVEIVDDPAMPSVLRITAIRPELQFSFFETYADILSGYSQPSPQELALHSRTHQAPQPNKAQGSGSVDEKNQSKNFASQVGAGSPRFFNADSDVSSSSSDSTHEKSVSFKLTQGYVSAPEGIQQAPLRSILDVAKDFAPPKFQTDRHRKSTDTVEQNSVVVIVRDNDTKSSNTNLL